MHGPFDRAAGRSTSIIVLKHSSTGEHRLVTSISTRASTEVLQIDTFTGELGFDEECASFDDEVSGSSMQCRASSCLMALHRRVTASASNHFFVRPCQRSGLPSNTLVPLPRRPAPCATSRPGASLPLPVAAPCWATLWRAPPPACCSRPG
jgi:hypothetical protein